MTPAGGGSFGATRYSGTSSKRASKCLANSFGLASASLPQLLLDLQDVLQQNVRGGVGLARQEDPIRSLLVHRRLEPGEDGEGGAVTLARARRSLHQQHRRPTVPADELPLADLEFVQQARPGGRRRVRPGTPPDPASRPRRRQEAASPGGCTRRSAGRRTARSRPGHTSIRTSRSGTDRACRVCHPPAVRLMAGKTNGLVASLPRDSFNSTSAKAAVTRPDASFSVATRPISSARWP